MSSIDQMLVTDIEYGQYLWLDYQDGLNLKKHTVVQDTVSVESTPDADYVDNYYNDDLEKTPNLRYERLGVIAIYATIGLMLFYSFIHTRLNN